MTLGASGMLAKQIEAGAPYDVFLSANERYVTELAASGRLEPASVRLYAFGRLGLWSRDGKIHDVRELTAASVQHVAIANPAHAPYGAAAQDFLERLHLWKALQPKIVYGENVRETLEFAESGNADAAITAWSLLFDHQGAVLLPEDHTPIRQAGGIVKGTSQPDAARRFMEFLVGPYGQALLAAHGLKQAKP